MADMDLPPHRLPAPTYTIPSDAFSDPPSDFLFRPVPWVPRRNIGSQGILKEAEIFGEKL